MSGPIDMEKPTGFSNDILLAKHYCIAALKMWTTV